MDSLDVKDKRILIELERNARQPNTQIARTVGLSSDVVKYRIDRLEKRGIIKGYLGYINFHKIGYLDYGLYIGLQRSDKEKEAQFKEYLIRHDRVTYFSKVGGHFSFIVGLLARDSIEFHKQLKDLSGRFGSIIYRKELITRISLQSYPRSYLLGDSHVSNLPFFGGNIQSEDIDYIDKSILSLLATDARISIVEMHQKLDIPASTMVSRIKNLESKKIITGYYALISSETFGYQSYNLLIKVPSLSESQESSLRSFCESHPNVTWLITTAGAWDFEIGVEVENQERLQEIIDAIKDQNQSIMDIDFLTIFNNLKYNQYPFKNDVDKKGR